VGVYQAIRRRFGEVWIPILFATVAGAAVIGILFLRQHADDLRRQLVSLGRIESSSLAQKEEVTDLLATGVVVEEESPIFREELSGTVQRIEDLKESAQEPLRQLLSDPDIAVTELDERYEIYESLVTVQAELLQEHDFQEAWGFQRRNLTTGYNELVDEIDVVRSDIEARAAAAGRAGSLGVAGVFALAMALIFLLWKLVSRQRARFETVLRHQALHDGLTSLANSTLFREELERALAVATRRGSDVALIYCDLDNFKPVNDTFGHHIGDAVLIEVSERLRKCVRSGDLVARLGGDEFGILVLDVKNMADVQPVSRRVIDLISSPFLIGEHVVSVGVSLGVAFGSEAESGPSLIQLADGRMYEVKKTRKGAGAERRN
jgi:diguanylate cyclase (GGDEF)-like protein